MPKLTFAERWILSNQYRILQKLEDEPIHLYEEAITILERGYEDEYKHAAQYVSLDEDILPATEAQETRDILRMFSEMKHLYDHRLEDKEGINTALLEFRGFDGNNSPSHLAYADFLIERGDYPDLELEACPDSHSDNIGVYREMVQAWKQLGDQRGLLMTKEGLQAILDAPRVANLPLPDNVVEFPA